MWACKAFAWPCPRFAWRERGKIDVSALICSVINLDIMHPKKFASTRCGEVHGNERIGSSRDTNAPFNRNTAKDLI